jgi:hypothetical protein
MIFVELDVVFRFNNVRIDSEIGYFVTLALIVIIPFCNAIIATDMFGHSTGF